MHDRNEFTSPRVSTPPNAFDPAFLERVQEGDEPLTAAEADLAGPWKIEPCLDHPGAVAVLRVWESQEKGDLPEAVFLHEETAALFTVLLPLIEREPLSHLHDQPSPHAPLPGGHPMIAVYGEQGPQVSGWLRRYHPELMVGLHLLEALTRAPHLLAEVIQATGGGAFHQIGRILAERFLAADGKLEPRAGL